MTAQDAINNTYRLAPGEKSFVVGPDGSCFTVSSLGDETWSVESVDAGSYILDLPVTKLLDTDSFGDPARRSVDVENH